MLETEGPDSRRIAEILAGLSPAEPPRLAFLRRASEGLTRGPGTLLCLSASFNPMTIAHTALIREGGGIVPAEEILLLLATANVDKTGGGLPLERRFSLLLRYVDARPNVSVAAVCHGRFVDKMEAIRNAYPADIRVVFLLGFDTLTRLFDAKYYGDRTASLARLFSQSECAVANRGPDAPSAVQAFLARPEVSPYVDRIHLIRLPANIAAVSATEVRTRLACGEPIAGLVPPEIRRQLEAWARSQRAP